MKKFTCALLFAVSLLAGCFQDDEWTGYAVKLEVTGNCPIVRIDTNRTEDYFYYYDLGTEDYVSDNRDGIVEGRSRTYYIDVYKHTADATTVTATIYVDGVQVATQTTTAAYGHIRVEYTLQN